MFSDIGIMTNYKILAIIPARGGSKEVPKKNIKELAGKPLIVYTIEAAKKSEYINRIVVSTDDPRIADISLKYGAETPYLRSSGLAADTTPTLPVLRDIVRFLEKKDNYQPDIIVLLQPTSPLRTAKTIDEGIEKFLKNKRKTLISVSQVKENPFWMKVIKNGYLYPFIKNKHKYLRRQDLPEIYITNGALYICEAKKLSKEDPFNNDEVIPFITDRRQSLDIDDPEDFILAEYYLSND